MKPLHLKSLLLVSALATTFSLARATDLFDPKLDRLETALAAHCPMPAEPLHPYAKSTLKAFLRQFSSGGSGMLNTAFLRGFTIVNSGYFPAGYCVVVFMNKANDTKDWERNSNFYKEAEAEGTLPTAIFDGFDDQGQVKLKPLAGPNN